MVRSGGAKRRLGNLGGQGRTAWEESLRVLTEERAGRGKCEVETEGLGEDTD